MPCLNENGMLERGITGYIEMSDLAGAIVLRDCKFGLPEIPGI